MCVWFCFSTLNLTFQKLDMIGIHVQWSWNGFANTLCHVWQLKYYSSLWINFICFSVLKTGLNIILACSIPKNSPMLEVWSLSHSLSLMYVCAFSMTFLLLYVQPTSQNKKVMPSQKHLRIYIVVPTFYLDINNHFTILAYSVTQLTY